MEWRICRIDVSRPPSKCSTSEGRGRPRSWFGCCSRECTKWHRAGMSDPRGEDVCLDVPDDHGDQIGAPCKFPSFGHSKHASEVGDIQELDEVEFFICDHCLQWDEACVCHRCGDILSGFCLAVHIQREVCRTRPSANDTNCPVCAQEDGFLSISCKLCHRDFHAPPHSLHCCFRSEEVGNYSKGCFLQRPLCSSHS